MVAPKRAREPRLASGEFGDSLNHAYKLDAEGVARRLLYGFDRSNELNIKAHLLKGYAEDSNGSFTSNLVANGLFAGSVEEAWKNYETAREALNDMLLSSKREPIPREIAVDPDVFKLRPYLEYCLWFERFGLNERNEHDLREMVVNGQFFARTLAINYRRILFDIVVMNPSRKHRHQRRR
jgi:hypothetical protein